VPLREAGKVVAGDCNYAWGDREYSSREFEYL
jgi:hypothetical protein